MDVTAADADQEREDLEALVRSPGWERFCRFARREWLGPGYRQRMREALDKNAPPEVLHGIDYTSRAVETLLTFPMERLNQMARNVEQRQP